MPVGFQTRRALVEKFPGISGVQSVARTSGLLLIMRSQKTVVVAKGGIFTASVSGYGLLQVLRSALGTFDT